MSAQAASSAGLGASALISDCFTLSGLPPGSAVNLEARLRLSGNIPSGVVIVTLGGNFTPVSTTRQFTTLNEVISQTVRVTAGTAFQLVTNLTLGIAGDPSPNSVNMALEFGLPAGAVITSVAGYPTGQSGGGGAGLSVSPTSISFSGTPGTVLGGRSVSINNTGTGTLTWTAAASTVSGGNWLSVSPTTGNAPGTMGLSGNTSGLSPGIYLGQVVITAAGAANSPVTVFVTLTVTQPPPSFTVSPAAFSVAGISGAASTQHALEIASLGGAANWTAAVTLLNGSGWLTLSPASGSATSAQNSATFAQVNYSALSAPGAYQALITITDSATRYSQTVPFSLTLRAPQARIGLSQSAFLFTAVQGGSAPPPQTLRITNTGAGTLSWSLPANPSAPQNWLSVSPASGTTSAGGQASTATLTANPTGLAAGVYQALAQVASTGAANDPELVSITLQVVPSSTPAAASLSSSGLVFVAAQGGAAPAAQTLAVSNSGGGVLTFQLSPSTTSGGQWLSAAPSSGSTASGPVSVQVTVNPSGLAAGIYRGRLTGTFSAGSPQEIEVVLVISSEAVGAAIEATHDQQRGASTVAVCTPQSLELVASTLGSGQTLAVSFPKVLLALAVDSCGTPLNSATVVAAVEGVSIPLQAQGNGLYSGTWVPQRPAAAVPITLTALHPSFAAARRSFTVATSAAPGAADLPVLFSDGVVEGAGFARRRPLAPGGIISLFGARMATSEAVASRLPLDRELSNTSVRIGRFSAPLYYVSPGQINAQVPYEVGDAESVTVLVSSGGRLTLPQTYLIAPVQPGVFSSGGTAAVLDGQSRPISASNPARLGDTLQIFATGLGAIDPAVETGAGAPGASRVRLVVTVTIGGVQAPVVYQGLAPNFVGLYQVNVTLPTSVAPGDAVQVVIRQNGIPSNPEVPVTIPVRAP